MSWGKMASRKAADEASAGPRLSVPSDWWIRWRDDDPVKAEFAKAHAEHWVAVVDLALKRNAKDGIDPCSWTGLAGIAVAMHVDPGHMSRQKKGGHPGLNGHFFLALAAVLNEPIEKFFPEKGLWIAMATERLCRTSVTRGEADMFASYCLNCVPMRPGLGQAIDGRALRKIAGSGSADLEAHCAATIVRVDNHLSRVLQGLLR